MKRRFRYMHGNAFCLILNISPAYFNHNKTEKAVFMQ